MIQYKCSALTYFRLCSPVTEHPPLYLSHVVVVVFFFCFPSTHTSSNPLPVSSASLRLASLQFPARRSQNSLINATVAALNKLSSAAWGPSPLVFYACTSLIPLPLLAPPLLCSTLPILQALPLESGQRRGYRDRLSAPEGAAKVCDEHLSAACAPCHGSAGAEQSLFVPLMSSSAGSSLQRFSQGSVPTVLPASALLWMEVAIIV